METVPPGHAVSIDGLPGPQREVAAGEHVVWVDEPCFGSKAARVSLKDGEERLLRIAAVPRKARLSLAAEDASGRDLQATAVLDGAPLGPLPGTWEVGVCSKTVTVDAAGGRAAASLKLEEGKAHELRLRILSAPAGTSGPVAAPAAARPGAPGWLLELCCRTTVSGQVALGGDATYAHLKVFFLEAGYLWGSDLKASMFAYGNSNYLMPHYQLAQIGITPSLSLLQWDGGHGAVELTAALRWLTRFGAEHVSLQKDAVLPMYPRSPYPVFGARVYIPALLWGVQLGLEAQYAVVDHADTPYGDGLRVFFVILGHTWGYQRPFAAR